MKISAPFILFVIAAGISTSSLLRAQGCFRYSYGPPLAGTSSTNGGVLGPASGSQTDTYSAAGYQYCTQNTTSTQAITSAYFVSPGNITANFGPAGSGPGGPMLYANGVVPNPFVVCNGQILTQGTAKYSFPMQNPPETFSSTISGTTLTEIEVDAGKASIQTSTSVFDVTTGVQQASLVENSYSFVPQTPQGNCSEESTTSIAYSGTVTWQVTATPLPQTASAVNPYSLYVRPRLTPQTLDPHDVFQWPGAGSVAADGNSAVVLVYQSPSNQPATVTLSASGSVASGAAVGSLSRFDPSYLAKPKPPSGGSQSVQVSAIDSDTCAAINNCRFLALLWGPAIMPTADASVVTLTATFTQSGLSPAPVSVTVGPPPLLLVHGIWSNPVEAGFVPGAGGFADFIAKLYPNQLVFPVDYSNRNSQSFDDAATQLEFLTTLSDALAAAAGQSMAARSVDVVAHSMGGLVARNFLSQGLASANPALIVNPIHQLITIGTPHQGTQLATILSATPPAPVNTGTFPGILAAAICASRGISPCTLAGMMAALDKAVGAGVASLQPGSTQLQALTSASSFSAIAGEAPTGASLSRSQALLDILIGGFYPGDTVATILGGQPNDTIVPVVSQNPGGSGQIGSAVIPGIVHTNLCGSTSFLCPDIGETQSSGVWAQAFNWLTFPGPSSGNGGRQVPATQRLRPETTAAPPPPVLDLTAYTQVAASNVTITPATNTVLTVNTATNITAASPTKTISELLLIQAGSDPSDITLMLATQAPFAISFTPTRLGSTSFVAVTAFTDKTYAITNVRYTFQPFGNPVGLVLSNLPVANMSLGDSRNVKVTATFDAGPVDVTALATYATVSGTANVFQAGSGGVVTAAGTGIDTLQVTYMGLTATAPIAVGACTYSLSPVNQLVPYTGGNLTLQMAAPPGCAWNAAAGASWLTLNTLSGSGSGAISLTAAPNATGNLQSAGIAAGGATATMTQLALTCTYVILTKQISAPQTGGSGTINVITSCPVAVASNVTWLTASASATSVSYTAVANSGPARSGVLMVGTTAVTVNQPAGPALTITLAHTESLYPGETNATYLITVANGSSAASTSGSVAVTEDPAPALTLASMSGTGWTCAPAGTGCTRSDVLAAGASYPPITAVLSVAGSAMSAVTNQVLVAGGGSPPAGATNVATVKPFSSCDLSQDRATDVSDVQIAINQALGLASPANQLTASGAVSVLDVQIVIDALLMLGCSAL